jgi:hypothetical protein
MRLSYVSAEKFTIEVIISLRFDRDQFSRPFSYRGCPARGRYPFIAGKERT